MKIINGIILLVLPLFASGHVTYDVFDREPPIGPPPTTSGQGGDSLDPEGFAPVPATSGEGGDSLEPENPAPIAPATSADANSPTTSGAKGQGRPMGISEKRQCYVFGQCQEYSVNFQKESDADSCHKFCGKNEDCEWWSFEPSQSMCMAFKNCTESGHPDTGACPDCISGERLCPARECHAPTKCDGHLVDSHVMGHLEDCIRGCNDNPSCEYYTFEKSNDHCVLYEDRGACEPCDTCASGEKKCSLGFHGTDSSAFLPETPSNTEVYTRIDSTTPVCDISTRISKVYAECFAQCGQPLITNDYKWRRSENWKCYTNCGLPKLGYEPSNDGANDLKWESQMSDYYSGLKNQFWADRRAYGDDADMGMAAKEYFIEACNAGR